ncbi:MAG TPA: MarR family transcriptional regulator [Candidatus Limnocylindrales bacterium]|nr:MarR family transcriptional regulator [Candidatus Limnocylindrales bacterium]
MDDDLLQPASDAFGGVFVLAGHLARLTDEGLADWGLTTRQWLLLAVLAKGFPARSPSLTEAAQAYGTTRQNVKQIAMGLEARGWLRLVPDPRDRRTIRLEVTDRVRIFDEPEGRDRGRAVIEAAFNGLTRDEVLDLRRLVGRWWACVSRASSTHGRPGKVQQS